MFVAAEPVGHGAGEKAEPEARKAAKQKEFRRIAGHDRGEIANKRRHDVWRVNEDAEYTEAGVSGAEAALGSERLVPRKVA